MNSWRRNIALLTCSLLLVGASACVEQEPSMKLEGSVLFEGEIDEETGAKTCEVTLEFDSVENVSERGRVDISELETVGQEGPPFETDEYHPSFVFWGAIQNLLQQSTQVGAGGGASGGNFEGLQEDQNYIMVTEATIRFPSSLNKFDGASFAKELEKKELFTSVLESNGGGAVVSFPIFSQRDIDDLKTFYQNAVQASGLAADTQDAIVPLIAEIQIKGETFSGREVESNKFQYPIDLCMACNELGPGGEDKFQTTSTCYFPPQ